MKIIGINGSPRKGGNTAKLINCVLEELNNQGIETELIELSELEIKPCIGCMKCIANKNMKCVFNDSFNEIFAKIAEVDGIVLGSPVYNASITAQMKAFTDKLGIVSLANDNVLKHKVGGAVVAARRGGAITAFDTMNHLFQIHQMFIVGANYWNDGYGMSVEEDKEGLSVMKNLGENMAWLLRKINK